MAGHNDLCLRRLKGKSYDEKAHTRNLCEIFHIKYAWLTEEKYQVYVFFSFTFQKDTYYPINFNHFEDSLYAILS